MIAFKTAFRTGILPEAFWNMTPNELRLCVEAANDQHLAERERDIWWAWHVAFLHRVDVKHFPKLTDLVKSLRPKPKSSTTNPDDRKIMSRNLMNALLQFPTAPRPPKDQDGVGQDGRSADIVIFPASDQPVSGNSPDEAS